MSKFKIDINADLGEGYHYDAQIMPFISSCSIACGGHFGDKDTMRESIRLAMKYNVKTGAHPSFPDKEGFGRKIIHLEKRELKDSLIDQIENFQNICKEETIKMNHVKLHGALYNFAAIDKLTAEIVIEVMQEITENIKLYVPGNSVLSYRAVDRIPLVNEAFIDRRYNSNGTLVSREINGSIISSPEEAWEQLYDLVTKNEVTCIDGKKLHIPASTYCIHGDHTNSVEILEFITLQMKQNNMIRA